MSVCKQFLMSTHYISLISDKCSFFPIRWDALFQIICSCVLDQGHSVWTNLLNFRSQAGFQMSCRVSWFTVDFTGMSATCIMSRLEAVNKVRSIIHAQHLRWMTLMCFYFYISCTFNIFANLTWNKQDFFILFLFNNLFILARYQWQLLLL